MRNPWPLLFTATLAVVTTLSLMPQPPQSIDLGWDKLNHALAFAVLTVLAPGVRRRASPWWGVAAWLLAWGVWIEGAQALGTHPSRRSAATCSPTESASLRAVC